MKQAEILAGEAPGTTSEDAERIRQLEQENRALKRERDPAGGVGLLRGTLPPTEMSVDSIDHHRDEFAAEPICEVLQVAPYTNYDTKSRPRRCGRCAMRR